MPLKIKTHFAICLTLIGVAIVNAVDSPATQPDRVEIVRHEAPASGGNGAQFIDRKSSVGVSGQLYSGFVNGVVVQGAGGFSASDCIATGSYRASPSDVYGGQGFYTDACGSVSLSSCMAYLNGWQPDKPLKEKTEFRHGYYQQFGTGHTVISGCIFASCPNAGAETRSAAGTEIDDCVFIDCGNAVLSVMGPVKLHHCLIYSGHYVIESAPNAAGQVVPRDGTSNSAIDICGGPIDVDDCVIVGSPGQGDAVADLKCSPQGCVVVSRTWGGASSHPLWRPPPAGDLLTATGCKIVGWPGDAQAGSEPYRGNGFAAGGQPVAYDWQPIIADVLAGKLAVAQAEEKIQSEVRAKVGAK